MKKVLLVLVTILLLSLTACNKEYDFVLFEGQDTVEINTTWEDAGAGLDMETYWKEATSIEGEVDATTLGQYDITYTITYDDITYQITRYVQVVDQTKPVITLNPGVDTIYVGNPWEDAGATVTDNSGEQLTVTISGEVDTNTIGTYEVVYTAVDSSGNESSLTRYVDVLE
jgi:hypothetical protein